MGTSVSPWLRSTVGAALSATADTTSGAGTPVSTTTGQGLTLVHFPAQCKRFLWDRGCI